MRILPIHRPEPTPGTLDLVYEPPLDRVQILARSVMDYGRVPFRIYVHFELLFHLHVAPGIIYIHIYVLNIPVRELGLEYKSVHVESPVLRS